jgi:hypothetical protein
MAHYQVTGYSETHDLFGYTADTAARRRAGTKPAPPLRKVKVMGMINEAVRDESVNVSIRGDLRLWP